MKNDVMLLYILIQGMIVLILEIIDKFSQYKSFRYFVYYVGEEVVSIYEDIVSYFYFFFGMFIF